jgi:hypothetical protein
VLLAELIRDRIASLRKANEAALKRKKRKKKRLKRSRVLKKEDREDIFAQQEAKSLVERERC